jgi:hypothetical protein
MAITNIAQTITLGSNWHNISLGSEHSFYLVGVKESKGSTDTIDPINVKRISFELGIDAGVSQPLTIGNLTLNFDEHTSNDKELNVSTAMVRAIGYPTDFKIKPTQIYTDDNKCHVEGITTIGINIIPVSLK